MYAGSEVDHGSDAHKRLEPTSRIHPGGKAHWLVTQAFDERLANKTRAAGN
jgi:hypothetical protein